jgi:hypothetical protein
MSHWLEEAERKKNRSRRRSRTLSKKIADKKRLIRENFETNQEAFTNFIKMMYEFVGRVNELPDEYRENFKKLTAAPKKNKLDNKLNIFSSSRREQKVDFFSFAWLKPSHFKHIRVFYIYISKESGFVNFEFKENILERKRISSRRDKSDEDKKPSDQKDRMHVIYRYPINQLNRKTGLELIDWLVFKEQIQDLNIWTDIPIESKRFF